MDWLTERYTNMKRWSCIAGGQIGVLTTRSNLPCDFVRPERGVCSTKLEVLNTQPRRRERRAKLLVAIEGSNRWVSSNSM